MTAGGTDTPPWLPQAWRVRAILLTIVLGLLAMAFYGQVRESGGTFARVFPGLAVIGIALALAGDWVWLKRNHHRVNEWGMSKGKDARKKPK